MRQDIGLGMAGIGDGGDDITCLHAPADFNSAARLGMGIKGYKTSGTAAGIIMFYNHGLTEIVFEHGFDNTILQNRYATVFIESAYSLRAVLVKAQINAFMGKISQAVITPPFVRAVEQHPMAKDPFLKFNAIQTVCFDEHRAILAILQGYCFHEV